MKKQLTKQLNPKPVGMTAFLTRYAPTFCYCSICDLYAMWIVLTGDKVDGTYESFRATLASPKIRNYFHMKDNPYGFDLMNDTNRKSHKLYIRVK